MRAPFKSRPKTDNDSEDFPCNDDPKKLDEALARLYGPEARKIGDFGTMGARAMGEEDFLSDEVKWLIVTHKSFDHGRRGFNDRLAFLGKNAEYHTSSQFAIDLSDSIPDIIHPNETSLDTRS